MRNGTLAIQSFLRTSAETLGVRFLIVKTVPRTLGVRETPKTLCFLCRTFLIVEVPLYRGTSLIRNRGPYSKTTPRALRWFHGEGRFLMSEVPL